MKVNVPFVAICTASVIAVGTIAAVIIVNANKNNNTPTILETVGSSEEEYIEKLEESENELLPGEVLLEEDPQTDAEIESIRGSTFAPEVMDKLEENEISLEGKEDTELFSNGIAHGNSSSGNTEISTSMEESSSEPLSQETSSNPGEELTETPEPTEPPTHETADNSNALPIDFRNN